MSSLKKQTKKGKKVFSSFKCTPQGIYGNKARDILTDKLVLLKLNQRKWHTAVFC